MLLILFYYVMELTRDRERDRLVAKIRIDESF